MTNYNIEEIKLLNWQFILSSSFIISILISLSLTYNEILKNKNMVPLYSSKKEYTVLIFNRILATTIAFGFLIINITDKNVRLKYDNCDKKVANLQINASTLTLIATIIVLYLSFNNNEIDFENPEL